ncbi:MAG: MFS transporter [Defluviicoccus sp.]|nr:MFS transporter [Defluviicoccus sp.]
MKFFSGINRNVALLALCQALMMTTTSAIIASAALIGYALAEDKALATVPVAFQFIATMLTSIPASLYMRRVGRRMGFITGAAIGGAGGTIATVAIVIGSFWLFAAGVALIGSLLAFGQFFRFAAADTAGPDMRGRAISLVLLGGVVAAFTGPNLARLTKDLFDPLAFVGTFAAVVLIYVVMALVLSFLTIPPMSEADRRGPQRPLLEILGQTKCIVAIFGAVSGYGVMTFVMTVTPLAMADCGFSFGDSATVIQWHIIGMFLPSFFTGHLVARYGATNIMIVGGLLQALCVAINLAGIEYLNFVSALILLGVGWNFLFIGGTTLLTECYRPAEMAKTQGFNDFCIWGFVAVGAVLSGASNHHFGWAIVNAVTVPLIAMALIAAVWLRFDLARSRATA